MNGKVKFFNESKGFGFITTDAGEDVFVHISALEDCMTLNEGEAFLLKKLMENAVSPLATSSYFN